MATHPLPAPFWQGAQGHDAHTFHSIVVHLTAGRASKRPLTAVRVLSALFALTPAGVSQKPHKRWQLAQEARVTAADASRALRDLESLGVVTRSGRGPATSFALADASSFMELAKLPPDPEVEGGEGRIAVIAYDLGIRPWDGLDHGVLIKPEVDED